jgi:hypothetical protein
VAGYQADLSAITATGAALRETADTLLAARSGLAVSGAVGPGRLAAAVASLTEDARGDLDRVLGMITEDAGLVHAAARGYQDVDQAAADILRRRADD